MSDGPDVWCYDALETRVFANGSAATAVLRSLEVIETNFDSNPAMYVTVLLAKRTIEEYLAAASDDDEAARYIRAVRTPGSTTRVLLESKSHPITWWTLDGVAPHAIPEAVPGPSSAGLVDETPPEQRVPRWRAVVTPGHHVIRYVTGDRREVDRAFEISAGQCLVLAVEGDA